MGGRPPTPPRWRRSFTLAGLALTLAVGCRGGPTLDEAQSLLRAGDPEAALDVARRASARAPAEERLALRRLALQAALAAGLPREGAREYQLLRRLTGRDDDGLLAEVAGATLRRAVTGDDPARRVRGVEALDLLGADPRALALLRTALADPREEVRAAAVAAALTLPDAAAAARHLAAAARGDVSPWVRRRALDHLAELLAARELPPALRAELVAGAVDVALNDGDEDARVAAVRLLARGDRAVAVEGLAREVGRGSDAVRCAAALELLRLDPAAAAAAWTASDLPLAADDPTGALGLALQVHAPADPGEGTLDAVRAALRAPAYRVRLMAARGLAGPGALRLAPALRALALDDVVQPVRGAALEALVLGAPEAARGACRRALGHVDPATRRRALEGLERLDALTPGDHVGLLRDPALADLSARWLATRGGEPGFQALVRALGDPAGAQAALEALAEQGDRRMRGRFVDLLTAPERADARALVAAARGLARCGEPSDRPLLLAMLTVPGGAADVAAAALLVLQGHATLAAPLETAE